MITVFILISEKYVKPERETFQVHHSQLLAKQ